MTKWCVASGLFLSQGFVAKKTWKSVAIMLFSLAEMQNAILLFDTKPYDKNLPEQAVIQVKRIKFQWSKGG
jgi:hypothetical protein